MKLSKNVLILLLLTCPIFSWAQYNQMRRGEVSMFEESVNIEISEYRKIRRKVLTADSLRQSWESERLKLEEIIQATIQRDSISNEITLLQAKTIDRKDSVIQSLSRDFEDLAKVQKKFIIFKNPIADTLAKVAIGVLLRQLFIPR
jgi:hypothetical protein